MIRHNGIEIDRGKLTITIRGKTMKWYTHQQTGFRAIERLILAGPEGATREEIYEATHGDRADGGTEGGPHDVHVWLTQSFKPAFNQLGVELRRCRHPSANRIRYSLHVV